MNWASLLLAVVFGTPAVVLLVRRKAPRGHAILFALAVLCLLAGVPSLLAFVGHPIGAGWILLAIVIAAIVSAMFFYFDVIRGEHKSPLGHKGGGAAAPGAGGGKANHHIRPLVASVGLAVFGLMVVINGPTILTSLGNGFSHTSSTISHTS